MYFLNIVTVLNNMCLNEIRNFENYYNRIIFSGENSYYFRKRLENQIDLLLLANKLIEKNT